jgi:hypothetical protein
MFYPLILYGALISINIQKNNRKIGLPCYQESVCLKITLIAVCFVRRIQNIPDCLFWISETFSSRVSKVTLEQGRVRQ